MKKPVTLTKAQTNKEIRHFMSLPVLTKITILKSYFQSMDVVEFDVDDKKIIKKLGLDKYKIATFKFIPKKAQAQKKKK